MRLGSVKSITLVAVAAACSLSGTPYGVGNGTPPPNGVYMVNTTYNPNNLTVAAGTTVTWTNQDPFQHAVVYSSGPDSVFTNTIPVGGTFQHIFTSPGTYSYYCAIHGTPTTGMHATVTAQ